MNKQKDFGKGWRDYKTKRKQQTEEIIGIIQKSVGGCARNWASLIAEELIKYYQPKIPEGAVVLTREEFEVYEFVKKMYASNEEVRSSEIVQGILHHIKTVRKETAEKFAEMVSKAFFGLSCIDIDEWNWCQNKIDEICKEITEGEV